jgi:hypothetical protein
MTRELDLDTFVNACLDGRSRPTSAASPLPSSNNCACLGAPNQNRLVASEKTLGVHDTPKSVRRPPSTA